METNKSPRIKPVVGKLKLVKVKRHQLLVTNQPTLAQMLRYLGKSQVDRGYRRQVPPVLRFQQLLMLLTE